MNKRILYALILLVVVAAVIVIMAPMMLPGVRTPAWVEDGGVFLKKVGIGLRDYSASHGDNTPPTLAALYPKYVTDKRVVEPVLQFDEYRAVLIYWYPQKLGDPKEAVAQLVFDPGCEGGYQWYLWADGSVRLQRPQQN